jgi:hypothetical protein
VSDRCLLVVRTKPVSRGLRSGIARYLRYIERGAQQGEVTRPAARLADHLLWQGRARVGGHLFDAGGRADSTERQALVSFIVRSTADMKPYLYRSREGGLREARRAAYSLVLSPEHGAGLDLRRMTRALLAQLEGDAGGIGPWLAAEHRNTGHRHVHVVLAARRQLAPGRFRTVVLTRPRLERMKEAMYRELDRQRGRGPAQQEVRLSRWLDQRRGERGWRRLPTPAARRLPRVSTRAGRALRQLALGYELEAERAALERLRQRARER